jgi:hypothetical protein
MDPVDGGGSGDAEHLSQYDGWDLGGKLDLSGTACCSRIDAEKAEPLTELVGTDRPSG